MPIPGPAPRKLAFQVASILAPYDAVAPDAIDPAAVRALRARLAACASAPDCPDATAVASEAAALLPAEESSGPAFFAEAALVALLYLAQTLAGDPSGPRHAARRLCDALGFADDGGEAGLYEAAERFVAGPTDAAARALKVRVTSHAGRLARS